MRNKIQESVLEKLIVFFTNIKCNKSSLCLFKYSEQNLEFTILSNLEISPQMLVDFP